MADFSLPPLPWSRDVVVSIIPQKPPFMFVSGVLEFEPFKRLTAFWNVEHNLELFRGHFPGRPIVPGVILLEAMGQSASAFAFASCPERIGHPGVHLMGIDKSRFRKPVLPGDRVDIRVELEKKKGIVWRVAAHIEVAGEERARATFLASFLE